MFPFWNAKVFRLDTLIIFKANGRMGRRFLHPPETRRALLCDGGPGEFQIPARQGTNIHLKHKTPQRRSKRILYCSRKTGMKRAETAGAGLDCLLQNGSVMFSSQKHSCYYFIPPPNLIEAFGIKVKQKVMGQKPHAQDWKSRRSLKNCQDWPCHQIQHDQREKVKVTTKTTLIVVVYQ